VKTKAPTLATVYGTSPDLSRMKSLIGDRFLCGTKIELIASPCGTFHEVHNSKGRLNIVVVRKGKRFAFGTVAK
jgi:hypothetical protein